MLEIERTYDVPSTELALPPLDGARGVAGVVRIADEDLDATYYDTEDLRLARTRATLRRRSGGRDAGWHLKLPATGSGRHEIAAPVRGAAVPSALTKLVRSRTRGAKLRPVLRLVTHRQVLQLTGADGGVLAEVADDRVTAHLLQEPEQTHTWRELEVELVAGDEALLDAVEEVLVTGGAQPATTVSKLARALGERVPVRPTSATRTAGDVVLAHLREHVDELVARDPMVRRDEPDSVHKMRVATRRLRSALKTFRPLLDRSRTDPLREELTHLAGVLGVARDAEVLRDRLDGIVAEQPEELVLGPVRRRIRDELGGRYRAGHADVVAELDGRRYLALLDELEHLLEDPPWSERASGRAGKELPLLVGRSWARLHRAHSAAAQAASADDRALLLHEVRKAAKQARYAGEAVAPALGKAAARFAARAEAVQEALGEHQDSVVSREALRQLGVQAHLAGENGFTFGRLHGLEELRAERADAAFLAAWKALDRKDVLRWLR